MAGEAAETADGAASGGAGTADEALPRRSGRPLWQFLSLALVLAIVPVALVATGLLLAEAREERAKLERALANTARTLSVAVDREVRSYAVLLRTLAESQALHDGDLARFYGVASRVAQEHGAVFVSLFSADGRHLLNTARAYGSALPQPFLRAPSVVRHEEGEPPMGDISSLRRVLTSGVASNSNLFQSLSTAKLLVTVDVPVKRDGIVIYALNIAFEPAALQELLSGPYAPGDALGVIIDANDFILARWDGKADTIGRLANPDYRAARAVAPAFVTGGTSLEGRPVMFAAHTSVVTGWTSVASIEGERLDAASRRIWLAGSLMTLAALLVGAALAYYLGRRVNSALKSLVQVASGGTVQREAMIDAGEIIALRQALLRARRTESEAASERERAAAARARQAELEQSAREKDRFIATLSHELRNPLGVISNAIALMRHGGEPGKAIGILERQTQHLTRLIDDLLDLSRLVRGKIHLVRESLDLRAVLGESVELVQPRISTKGQQLTIEQPALPVRVNGDRIRLRQVIANLLDNAAKYAPAASAITVRLAAEDDLARLTVRDEGPGIDPANLESIFEPFVQVPDPRIHSTEGLGLGLPLAQQLLELHGGRIAVRNVSETGGCEVEIELPLAGGPATIS